MHEWWAGTFITGTRMCTRGVVRCASPPARHQAVLSREGGGGGGGLPPSTMLWPCCTQVAHDLVRFEFGGSATVLAWGTRGMWCVAMCPACRRLLGQELCRSGLEMECRRPLSMQQRRCCQQPNAQCSPSPVLLCTSSAWRPDKPATLLRMGAGGGGASGGGSVRCYLPYLHPCFTRFRYKGPDCAPDMRQVRGAGERSWVGPRLAQGRGARRSLHEQGPPAGVHHRGRWSSSCLA